MSFTMIANLCQNVWNDSALVRQRFLTNYRANGWNVESTVDVVNKATERLRDILTRTGFYFLFGTNPNVQYGTAKYRTTKREMDRVYAIMQLYDIKVGAAARPGAVVSSFRELQIEFAVAINKKCPIMGQSFTHTTAHLVPESTWCITQESTVPDILRVQYDSHPMCQISISEAGNGVATFRGKSCLYADLAERIKMTVPRAHGGINTFQHAVDAYVAAKLPELNSLLYPAFNSKDWHISDDIRVLFGKENLKVLYLGTAATSLRVATNRVAFGLIVSRKNPAITVDSTNRSNGTAARTYYRYGVVTWRELVIPDGVQVGNIEWTPEEIQLR
ncbi:hypothetical protein MN608_11589 [Microdochium nivale]|nr:hypothetical protein MN608_11589 [Microdochium nivale]